MTRFAVLEQDHPLYDYPLTGAVVVSLNDTIVAGLRAPAPRVEVDLRSVTACDADALRVLEAGRRIARHVGIELRITGGSGLGVDAA